VNKEYKNKSKRGESVDQKVYNQEHMFDDQEDRMKNWELKLKQERAM